ncbi:MAG: hypothetical protein COB61_002945 [Thiotrichales bacterium]|nr:hypothetical protein [Thiotrichales bacterium]
MIILTKLLRDARTRSINRKINKFNINSAKRRIRNLIVLLIALVVINSIVLTYAEDLSLADALWMSATTITTVGYGDIAPATPMGRLTTIVSLYLMGIAILSQLVTEMIGLVLNTAERKRKGLWEWKQMTGHIQIINTPNQDTETYLKKLVAQIRATPEYADKPIQLLTRKYPDGLPSSLQDQRVVLRTGMAEDEHTLRSLNLHDASSIIILARDTTDTLADSLTFDILSRLLSMGVVTQTVVEAVNDFNRERFRQVGANVVLRPVRAYPELVVRAMTEPGTEVILEDLFHYSDNHLKRVDHAFAEITWSDLLMQFINKNGGIPLGYIDAEERVHTNPATDAIVSGNKVIVLSHESQITV